MKILRSLRNSGMHSLMAPLKGWLRRQKAAALSTAFESLHSPHARSVIFDGHRMGRSNPKRAGIQRTRRSIIENTWH